jgi:hypothetical protein
MSTFTKATLHKKPREECPQRFISASTSIFLYIKALKQDGFDRLVFEKKRTQEPGLSIHPPKKKNASMDTFSTRTNRPAEVQW